MKCLIRAVVGVMAVIGASPEPASSQGQRSWVTGPPTLSLGQATGAPQLLFDGITGAVFQRAGRIAIADCGSGEIRFFSSKGEFISKVGGIGSGPGEHLMLARLIAGPGDSLATFDVRLRRLTVFSPAGQVVRTVPIAAGIDVLGWIAPDRIIGFQTRRMPVLYPGQSAIAADQRLARDSAELLILSAAHGTLIGRSPALPAMEAVYGSTGMPRTGMVAHRNLSVAVATDRVFAGTQSDGVFSEVDSSGRIIHRYGHGLVSASVTAATKRDLVDAIVARVAPDRRAAARRLWESKQWPRALPQHGAMLWGSGVLWVQDGYRPGVPATGWTAFQNRRSVGRVVLPVRFQPLVFGANQVMGIRADEYEVQRLQILPLRASAGDAQAPERDGHPPVPSRGGCFVRYYPVALS